MQIHLKKDIRHIIDDFESFSDCSEDFDEEQNCFDKSLRWLPFSLFIININSLKKIQIVKKVVRPRSSGTSLTAHETVSNMCSKQTFLNFLMFILCLKVKVALSNP